MVLKILKIFFIWRIALLIPILTGVTLLDYGNSYPFFEISYYKQIPEYLSNPLFKVWSNFDGVHYLKIATDGYVSEARFFPLFPLLIYFFSLGNITFSWTFLVATFLPNIFFIAALVVFYKLLRLDYSEKDSFETIINLLVFPTSFFFVCLYTESLFLFLTLACFYFTRRRIWLLVILLAMLLATIRFVGIFILPALIYEFFIQREKNYLKLIGLIFVVPLGLIAYAFYNFKTWGSFLYFLTAHSELGNSRSAASLITPPQTLYRYFKIFTNFPITQFEWWLAILEVGSFVFGSIMIYIAWKKKVRGSYLIFASLAFLLPSFSGTFSGLPRYLLIVFPIFIALSLVKSENIKRLYLIISAVLLFGILMFFSKGYFIA